MRRRVGIRGAPVLMALLWLVGGAGAQAAGPAPSWTLLAYLRTAGGLDAAAAGYVKQFDNQALAPQVRVAAQVETPGETGQARRLLVSREGLREAGLTRCGEMDSPGAVADFVRWGLQQAPADHVLLLVLGHGRPPGETVGWPGSLRASNLALGLAQATAGKLDVVFLDSCYGGSVETAATLEGSARYLVGAPGLIYAPGLPWGRILADLSGRPEMSPRELSALAVQETRSSWSGRPDSEAGLLALDLAQAAGLSQAVAQLAGAAEPALEQGLPALTLARGQAESWGPQGEMVDAGALAEALAQVSSSPAVAEKAERLGQAVRAATCAAWAQSGHDASGGGPALFFPLQPSARAAQYDSSAPASLTAVWGPFVRAYLQKLMHRAERGGAAANAA